MTKEKVKNLEGKRSISEGDYLELLKIKKKLDDILSFRKKERRERAFERAFGILKGSFKGKDSLDYIIELRKAWRK